METDADVVGELLKIEPGGRRSSERRLHGRRAVHQLSGRREQLDRDPRAGELAQGEYAFERGDACAGNQYASHRASVASRVGAGSSAAGAGRRGSTRTGCGEPSARLSETLPSRARCIGP